VTDRLHSSDNPSVHRQELRAHLQKLTDNELRQFGRAALHRYSSDANTGDLPRQELAMELEEARAESNRRFKPGPKAP
jgi:hypothetical protein